MTTIRTRALLALASLMPLGLAACNSASEVAVASLGMYVPGPADANALASLIDLPPTSSADQRGSFLADRLEAAISADATVGEVNDALKAHGAKVVWMTPLGPLVTLVVPPQPGVAAAQALSDALAAGGAFVDVWPASGPAEPDPGASVASSLQSSEAPIAEHHRRIRMPAAWNAKKLAELQGGPKVQILVPGHYGSTTPSPVIGAQTFLVGSGLGGLGGSMGLAACGIIGADPDMGVRRGVCPQPDRIAIVSFPIAGLTWQEMRGLVAQLAVALDDLGNVVICSYPNYGLSENPPAGVQTPARRALTAAAWRAAGQAFQADKVLHAIAGGDFVSPEFWGEAGYASPFSVAERFFDLSAEVLQPDPYTPAEKKPFYEAMLGYYAAAGPLLNAVIVGAAAQDGLALPGSVGPDMLMVGAGIPVLCSGNAGVCGTFQTFESSWLAAPQAAGLMAYLWTLAPTRPASEIRDIMFYAHQGPIPDLVDAYIAVLALDYSIEDARVRRTILDVNEVGSFEHEDIQMFLAAFENGSTDLRYDLNGDGIVGGSGGAWFDLDINHPPQFGAVTLEHEGRTKDLDETSVTDLDILCWYAHSDLYLGDNAVREEFLGGCLSPVTLTPSEVNLVRAGVYCGSSESYDVETFTGPGAYQTSISCFEESEGAIREADNATDVVLSLDPHTGALVLEVDGNATGNNTEGGWSSAWSEVYLTFTIHEGTYDFLLSGTMAGYGIVCELFRTDPAPTEDFFVVLGNAEALTLSESVTLGPGTYRVDLYCSLNTSGDVGAFAIDVLCMLIPSTE